MPDKGKTITRRSVKKSRTGCTSQESCLDKVSKFLDARKEKQKEKNRCFLDVGKKKKQPTFKLA